MLKEASRNFFEEFKKFALRGSVIDMAVGIMVGAAFNGIAQSLASDLLMPPLAVLLGQISLSDRFLTLSEGSFTTLKEAKEAGAVTLNYGLFLQNIVSFVLVAFTVFLFVKYINALRRMTRGEKSQLAPKRECPECLSPIPQAARRCAFCTAEVKR